MEEKPKHVEAGMDPFTYKKNEKKLEKEKAGLKQLKNQVLADGVTARNNKGKGEILDSKHVREAKGASKE